MQDPRLGEHDEAAGGAGLGAAQQGLLAEGFMHDAAAWPEGELAAALALHPAAQVLVGGKQDRPVGWQLLHQIHRVTAGADQVAEGFHRRRAVDVAHGDVVGVLGAEGGKRLGGAGIRQRAAGVQVRQQHGFGRAEDLGGLRHEVDAAENDHLGVGGGGFAR